MHESGPAPSRDTFIYEYVGDVVNSPSFYKRMRQYAEEGIRHFYFMMLQKDEVRLRSSTYLSVCLSVSGSGSSSGSSSGSGGVPCYAYFYCWWGLCVCVGTVRG